MKLELRREQMQELYESYKASGKSVSEYSRERGFGYWRVQNAIRRVEGNRSEDKFKEVKVVNRDITAKYELKLRNGLGLGFSDDFKVQSLKELVGVLEQC